MYTTQILEVAEKFSDAVCIIHQGRLHAYDRVERLQAQIAEDDGGVLEAVFRELHEEPT